MQQQAEMPTIHLQGDTDGWSSLTSADQQVVRSPAQSLQSGMASL